MLSTKTTGSLKMAARAFPVRSCGHLRCVYAISMPPPLTAWTLMWLLQMLPGQPHPWTNEMNRSSHLYCLDSRTEFVGQSEEVVSVSIYVSDDVVMWIVVLRLMFLFLDKPKMFLKCHGQSNYAVITVPGSTYFCISGTKVAARQSLTSSI